MSRRRNNDGGGRSGGGLGRIIRWILKIKLIIVILIIVLVVLLVMAVVSIISGGISWLTGLFSSSATLYAESLCQQLALLVQGHDVPFLPYLSL